MFTGLLLPAATTGLATVSTLFWRRRLSPKLTTRCATAFTVAAALAVLWGELTVVAGTLGQLPRVARWFGWCRDLYRPHDTLPAVIGLAAAAGLVLGTAALLRALVRERRALRSVPAGQGPIQLLDSRELVAFAAPGRPGRVVVSQGMLDALTQDEQEVLIAHETSHLAHRHHRFRVVARLAAAAVPPLRALAAEVTYATERWADEDAAQAVGDRRLVATAISRAAVASRSPHALPAMADSDVVARVEAILAPRPRLHARSLAAGSGAAVALTVAAFGSAVQLHHLVLVVFHICNR